MPGRGRATARTIALVVDHGLRPAAADEALATERLLTAHGIAVRVLRLAGSGRGRHWPSGRAWRAMPP